MSREDLVKLSSYEKGRDIDIESIRDDSDGEIIKGEFEIVDKNNISVDDTVDKILQGFLHPGNSRATEVFLKSKDTGNEITVVVNLEKMESAIKSK